MARDSGSHAPRVRSDPHRRWAVVAASTLGWWLLARRLRRARSVPLAFVAAAALPWLVAVSVPSSLDWPPVGGLRDLLLPGRPDLFPGAGEMPD